jgi:hypothetical protein
LICQGCWSWKLGGRETCSRTLRQRLADLPVVAERIGDAAYAPAVFVGDGPNHGGSGRDCPVVGGVGIFNCEDHPRGAAAQGFGAKVLVFRRLVGEPEFGSVQGESSDYASAFVCVAEDLSGSERCFVELDRIRSVSNGEHRGYGGHGTPFVPRIEAIVRVLTTRNAVAGVHRGASVVHLFRLYSYGEDVSRGVSLIAE